jgi:hypothetical protein
LPCFRFILGLLLPFVGCLSLLLPAFLQSGDVSSELFAPRVGLALPLLGDASLLLPAFFQSGYVLSELFAPRIRCLASLAEPDYLARTKSERRQQSQERQTSQERNTPALFGSFSASYQLRQVIESGNMELRVHRDAVVFDCPAEWWR